MSGVGALQGVFVSSSSTNEEQEPAGLSNSRRGSAPSIPLSSCSRPLAKRVTYETPSGSRGILDGSLHGQVLSSPGASESGRLASHASRFGATTADFTAEFSVAVSESASGSSAKVPSVSTGEKAAKKQKTTSNTPLRKSQRSSVLQRSAQTTTAQRRSVPSETIDRSNIILRLNPTHRLPFSKIPEALSFIKPLRNLGIEDQSEILKMKKSELPSNYASSIEKKGFDDSLVCVAKVSEEVGRGVFAARDIPKGAFIGFYAGDFRLAMHSERDFLKGYAFDPIQGVNEKQSPIKNKKVRQQLEKAALEAFGPHEAPDEGYEIIIDAEENGNFTSLINDGQTNANVTAELRQFNGQIEIALFANKPIRKGMQLLISYGSSYWPALEAAGKGRSVKLYPTRYVLADPIPESTSSSSSCSDDTSDFTAPAASDTASSSSSSSSASDEMPPLSEWSSQETDFLDLTAPAASDATSSSSSSSSALHEMPSLPELSSQETYFLDHFLNMQSLAAEMADAIEDTVQKCYVEAKALLRPSALKGSEEIAFCYFSLVRERLPVPLLFDYVEQQIRVISSQRYEMKMEVLRMQSLSSDDFRKEISEFLRLEKELSQGTHSKEKISEYFYQKYLWLYREARLPLMQSLAGFRAAEMSLHLAEYHLEDRSLYEGSLNNAMLLFSALMKESPENRRLIPLTIKLAASYYQECEFRINYQSPIAYGSFTESHEIEQMHSSSTSWFVQEQQLEDYKELKYLLVSSSLGQNNLNKLSLGRQRLLPQSYCEHEETALQMLDWAAYEAHQLGIQRREPPFRQQRFEMKGHLLQERKKYPQSRSLEKLLALEEQFRTGITSPHALEALYSDYKKLAYSSNIRSAIALPCLFRMGELCMNIYYLYGKMLDQPDHRAKAASYCQKASKHFIRLKKKLERQRSYSLPYMLKLVDCYLNEMQSV
ncbi:MAG: SET domain-containing protein-lysine N-methyltransferase [Chlamydiales bacterium]|nr:SET domain-containing protein-lysine N-methyltransferase [Chlamydiales bacterium]MBY0530186.1 SET domain-containing protein-lysine N-methyltransferase [Rhabdochlamydiaceae bacterium]